MPNPQFNVDFQLDNDNIPRQAMLTFEIRSASKEMLASRKVTLHELLGKIDLYFNFSNLSQGYYFYSISKIFAIVF